MNSLWSLTLFAQLQLEFLSHIIRDWIILDRSLFNPESSGYLHILWLGCSLYMYNLSPFSLAFTSHIYWFWTFKSNLLFWTIKLITLGSQWVTLMESICSCDQNGFYRFHQATLDSNVANGWKMHGNAFLKLIVQEPFTCACMISCFSCVRLFAALWTVAC